MPLNIMFTYPTLLISYVYIYCTLYHLLHLYVIHVSLATLNYETFVYITFFVYITHLICIYCTRYHLLHLTYVVLYHHSFIYLYVHILYIFFIPYVYKVVVVELLRLGYSLVITALSEVEAQAFHYIRINIC